MQHRRRPYPQTLFGEDFDQPNADGVMVLDDAADEPEEIPAGPTAAELAAAREEAYAEGLQSGLAKAAADRAEVTRQMLTVIAGQLAESGAEARQMADETALSVARLLLSTLAAVLPATCARHGAAEVSALVRALLPSLAHEPKVSIRVSPHVTEALNAELARLDPTAAARIVVVATDSVAPGDARISWEDGSAVRDAAALWRQVADALAPLGLLPQAADLPKREFAHS